MKKTMEREKHNFIFICMVGEYTGLQTLLIAGSEWDVQFIQHLSYRETAKTPKRGKRKPTEASFVSLSLALELIKKQAFYIHIIITPLEPRPPLPPSLPPSLSQLFQTNI